MLKLFSNIKVCRIGEWSINAKIMRVITKSTDRAAEGFVNHEYDLALIARLDSFYHLLIIDLL